MVAFLSHANFTFLSHDNARLLEHIGQLIVCLSFSGRLAKSPLELAAALGNTRAQACLILNELLFFGGFALCFGGVALDDQNGTWFRISFSVLVAYYFYIASKKAARQQFMLML